MLTKVALIVGLFLVSQSAAQESQPMAGEQVEMSFKTSDSADVGYLVYLPKDFKADGEKEFSLIFFLHGRGESNGPLSLVAKWGPPMMAARGDDLPYVIVSPQCPKEDNWSSETQQKRLTELLDNVVKKFKVNEQKLFLTGLSMGGYGSWTMAADHPTRFAAVAPVCGGGNPEDAGKLKDVPIWAFHGDNDRAVPFQKSVDMVEAIKAAGGESIRFTSLENIGHNCWSSTYATPELYQWMEKQVLSKPAAEKESAAADASGTWTWSRDFNGNTMNFTLKLQQDGKNVTGTYKTDFGDQDAPAGLSDPVEIESGELDGDKLSFFIVREFNGNEFTVDYSGVISGNEIEGVSEMDFGGESREFDWNAKRE